jgi:ABC-type branched-subunit amino acid transport system substrate-binding protein
MRRSRIFWILLIAVAMLTLVAVACGGKKEEKATPPAGTAAAKTPAASPQAGDTTGVTDTQILIGTHQPLTGPAAAYAQISKGMTAYFDYINEAEGGVYGR